MPGEVAALMRELLSPAGLADPYPVYDRLREAATAGRPAGRVLFRHADVYDALHDRDLRADRVAAILRPLSPGDRRAAAPLERTMRDIVAFTDPPGHTRVRRLLVRAFSARVVEQARPAIAATADRLLDAVARSAAAGSGVVDLHRELTYPLPAITVAALLGVPEAERAPFQDWAHDLVMVVGSGALTPGLAARATRRTTEMHQVVARLVERRRADPGPDLLSAMIAATDEVTGRLSPGELSANALFLMTAGHETATNLLGNGIVTLLRHPAELERLTADPALIAPAVEEILRFEGPVQMAARLTDRDRTLCGVELREGDPVVLLLGAAGRDPEVFPEPHRFDITRSPNPHLAFSHGLHFCLGAALARAEAQVVLPRLFERFPRLRLAGDHIGWQPTLDFRGPARLLVRT